MGLCMVNWLINWVSHGFTTFHFKLYITLHNMFHSFFHVRHERESLAAICNSRIMSQIPRVVFPSNLYISRIFKDDFLTISYSDSAKLHEKSLTNHDFFQSYPSIIMVSI
jgi:hypothetical protein